MNLNKIDTSGGKLSKQYIPQRSRMNKHTLRSLINGYTHLFFPRKKPLSIRYYLSH